MKRLAITIGLLIGSSYFQPAFLQTNLPNPKPISKQKQVFRYLLSKTSYDSALYLYKIILNESGNFKSKLSKHNNIAGLRYVPNSKAVGRDKKSQYLHYATWKDCIDDLLTYQRHYKKRSWYYSKKYQNFIRNEFRKVISK